ncbi:MAG: hypothetical protein HYY86_03795 [Candidatus Harrisonbacteria bacterium]|nr:hypothetical protein [Candidatus Harrisonbacteria bacterium]
MLKDRLAAFINHSHAAKNFFEKLNPVVTTLILMLVISVPITLVATMRNKGVNREIKQDIEDEARDKNLKWVGCDWVIKTPLKEELKFRGPIAVLTLLRNFEFLRFLIVLENPVIYFSIILPGLMWSEFHVVPYAALVDSVFLGLLVFRVGGIRGWLSALLVHVIINFSVFIGFVINTLIK